MGKKITIKQLFKRAKDSHKGDYGHVLIIAGSRGMSGAAILCGRGALRAGAGLVSIATPESIQPVVAASCAEAMTFPLPETSSGSMDEKAISHLLMFMKLHKITSVVLGPGISTHISSRMVVNGLMNNVTCAGVIDADGLNQLKGNLAILKNSVGNWIITPHPGELSRLLDVPILKILKNRKKYAQEAAKKSGSICVLKGYQTIVCDGKKIFINKTGNPGMATGGSGDVLAGIIGGFLAQGLNLFETARLGVTLHGLAGDLAAKEKGEISLIAGDIVEYIPAAIKRI